MVCRVGGKVIGSYIGGKISKADPVVMKYTGLGLFPQGGVAVGLLIMASQHLGTMELVAGLSPGDAVKNLLNVVSIFHVWKHPPLLKLLTQCNSFNN